MNEDPQDGVDERRLHLLREAEGADGHTYCPPLQAPMSVQQRYRARDLRANPLTHTEAVNAYRAIWTDEDGNAVDPTVERERKDFGAAIMVWACVMGGGILLAYGIHWAWNALTGGV